MKILETENLIFRQLEISDAEKLFRIYSNAETMKFMGNRPASLEEERKNLENHIKNYYEKFGFGFWAAILKDSGQFIGRCGLLKSEINGKSEIEIGYLLDRNFWGRNLATEAAKGIIKYAFEELKCHQIFAVILPSNIASKRVAEKCGFTFKEIVAYKNHSEVLLYTKYAD